MEKKTETGAFQKLAKGNFRKRKKKITVKKITNRRNNNNGNDKNKKTEAGTKGVLLK